MADFISFDCPTDKFIFNQSEIIYCHYDSEFRTFKIKLRCGDVFELDKVFNTRQICSCLGLEDSFFDLRIVDEEEG
ncbi:MAG: hypothetical protein DRI98_11880 [Bacteroidetes bacterium]|nr:MAG: hypothetical protein DRI98_11880 [Bacteroidota bacterium]